MLTKAAFIKKSKSHDLSESILIYWAGAQETFLNITDVILYGCAA